MNDALHIGFGRRDITPRVGVELCGFGPYLTRHSTSVRDRLWARAMAVRLGECTWVLAACDLIGIRADLTRAIRRRVQGDAGLAAESVMVACTHTHSGPNTAGYIGWGEPDEPYLEMLPSKVAAACLQALASLRPAKLYQAEVPCEGIGCNRESDTAKPDLSQALDDRWRPARPEDTDTTCRVLRVESEGRVTGFVSSFGCHPVVCCAETRAIHGDFCGVATHRLERDYPDSVGLFLQGAQGDVNSCVVHASEQESLAALDRIADRYARAVRHGLKTAQPFPVDRLGAVLRRERFSRAPWTTADLEKKRADCEAIIRAPEASDADRDVRMAVVVAQSLRRLLARAAESEPTPETELHGLRLGDLRLLGAPFEIFQAIKNDVTARTAPAPTWVLGLVNDCQGYAPDRETAEKGGYAAERAPLILGQIPFAKIHDELTEGLVRLGNEL